MKEDDIQQEAIKSQAGKSELERSLGAGINGGFELKKGERNRFLGEFRERVLKALTLEEVEEPGTYPEVLDAIKDSDAKKLIIDRRVDMDAAREYINLARKNNISFKKVSSPDFKGDTALVVVSDKAIHRDNISVSKEDDGLDGIGIKEEVIRAKGEKICDECYDLIEENAPNKLKNYKKMSWVDKLLAKKCPCEQ
ncbi:YueI family protein [Halonatronum saccharophilum]|uniref:YueI family protein n=1 Tax=Halonatronum saccharophilum TaxID=150060 RepID=UPI0004B53929|nr:YueI family protein [Halonatronum saccharophilum]